MLRTICVIMHAKIKVYNKPLLLALGLLHCVYMLSDIQKDTGCYFFLLNTVFVFLQYASGFYIVWYNITY